MKINKLIKIIAIFSVLIIFITLISKVYANPIDAIMDHVQKPEGEFINEGKEIRGKILFIVQLIGTIIAISMLLIYGIKYMMAAPEGKANIKHEASIYIVGAVLLFSSVGIVEIIKQFAISI